MTHATFVFLSYAIAAIVLFILTTAIILDGKRQKKRLAKLEALGAAKHARKAKQ